jgi:hypothetical protein
MYFDCASAHPQNTSKSTGNGNVWYTPVDYYQFDAHFANPDGPPLTRFLIAINLSIAVKFGRKSLGILTRRMIRWFPKARPHFGKRIPSMCPIAWDEGSPSSSAPRVRIYNNSHPDACIRALGELYRVFTHWPQGHTVPCLGDECPHCRAGTPTRKVGYAASRVQPWGGTAWTNYIWSIPERNLPDLMESSIGGLMFQVKRNSHASSKPLSIVRLDRPRAEIDPNFDVRKLLEEFWRPYVLSVGRAKGSGGLSAFGSADYFPSDDSRIIPYPQRSGSLPRMTGGA